MNFERFLDRYPPSDRDRNEKDGASAHRSAQPGLHWRRLPVQDSIDVHGMEARAAERAVSDFLAKAHQAGLQKVRIVYGKGLHSKGGRPVLKVRIDALLRNHPLAGHTETPGRELGGSGAIVVRIRSRRYRSR
jgi:DNA-nicking Smr family endonuclease